MRAKQELIHCATRLLMCPNLILQDDIYGVTFIQKSATAPTIISLFLAITQVLNIVLSKLRDIYNARSNEDHLLYLCIAEDRINVSYIFGASPVCATMNKTSLSEGVLKKSGRKFSCSIFSCK